MTSFLRTRKDRQPRPENRDAQPSQTPAHDYAGKLGNVGNQEYQERLSRTVDISPQHDGGKSYDKSR